MKSATLSCSLMMLLCLLTAGAAAPPVNAPAPVSSSAKADQSLENETIRVSPDGDKKTADAHSTAGAAAEATSSTADLMRVLVALVVVIAVILLLRAGVRRMASLPGGAKAGKLVTVLSRSMISPRQQILVLQVGKRLLVVGDSGGAMSPLCELNDPDEIASLIGQTRQAGDEASDRQGVSFGNIFKRAAEPFDDTEAPEETDTLKSESTIEPASIEEMGGLLDKVRLLQEQFKVRSEGTRT